MGRHALRVVIVLGVLVTLVGGTGIFAVFTDQATTGQNTANSGQQAKAADLQLNQGVSDGQGSIDCQQDPDANGMFFEDDLTTGIFSVGGMQPGSSSATEYLCLRNAGSSALALTANVIEVVDQELACTGDEQGAGDTTCGLDPNDAPLVGELSSALTVTIDEVSCVGGAGGVFVVLSSTTSGLASLADSSLGGPGATLAPNGVMCLGLTVTYPSDTSAATVQVAQSDQVSWRFRFDATAS